MAIKTTCEWIWFGGEWVPWDQATIHVSTYALHYGSSVFEGIRAYKMHNGTAVFRLSDHIRRLMFSCKVLRMLDGLDFTQEEIENACLESVVRNKQESCYIRPIAFRDSENMSLNSAHQKTLIAVYSIPWGRYLGEKGIEEGVDVVISSWRRVASSPMAKIGGQYTNNQQMAMEAARHGYAEGLALDMDGNVSEGSGENLFLVMGGELYTPPSAASILIGVTRDTVMQLAADLNLKVHEQTLSREMLYLADEIFMTGTAAEVTPIRSVDQLPVGSGKVGPVTKAIQKEFFGIVNGDLPDRYGWMTPVPAFVPEASGD